MKKLFLSSVLLLTACATYYDGHWVDNLSVEFLQPSDWNGRVIPAHQGCRSDGGKGSTPALYISGIPEDTNLLIMEINNLDIPELADNGGQGSIGFYHNGESTATLLPVPGETFKLPSFAFEEKSSRVNSSKPYPYMPPCLEKKYHYSLTVKAVNRTGSFDKQKTNLLGIGGIMLGTY